MSKRLPFTLNGTCPGTAARAATFSTSRNILSTPLFMPVGTRATVRGVPIHYLEAADARMLLANTYHLLLQPGPSLFKNIGGIHRFMGWNGSVLTDSGGYQIFSLAEHMNLTESGAAFRHPKTGRIIELTPEKSIAVQQAINSDIMMVLDECVPATADYTTALSATDRTYRWAKRSLAARQDHPAALFGIVQGACHEALRAKSAAEICALPFEGFAVGGLAVGERKNEREQFCELTASRLPVEKPRYLMGVGTPIDLLEAVHRGIDMFDCIIPTERAWQGFAFTFDGIKRVTRTRYTNDQTPLHATCNCPTCRTYTTSYLHHLFKANEPLGPLMLSIHNLFFYQHLTARMRDAILDQTFVSFLKKYRDRLARTDGGAMPKPKRIVPVRLGQFEVTDTFGISSIRHIESREVKYIVNPPDEEAKRFYIDPSNLAKQLSINGRPLVVWDVGLGAAHNAMAALRTAKRSTTQRELHLVSFETDLDALALTIKNKHRFPHICHAAPRAILENARYHHPDTHVLWELRLGDFFACIKDAPNPDIVYFAPFPSKTNPHLWQLACFEATFAAAKASGTLYTYANATSVRAALLAAGFFVAMGPPSGPKESTTIAAKKMRPAERAWLNDEWLCRFQRSSAPYPKGETTDTNKRIHSAVLAHPQFQKPLKKSIM